MSTLPSRDMGASRGVWALLATSSFVDGYNLIVAAPLILLLVHGGFSLSPVEESLVILSAVMGNFLGGMLLGHFGDLYGRRRTFLWDLGFFVMLPLLSAGAVVVGAIVLFIVLRVVLGVGIGGNYPLASVLLAEKSGAATRGAVVARLGIFWTLGAVVSYILSALLWPLGRLGLPLVVAAGVPAAVAVLILRRRLPESQMWIAAVGTRRAEERRQGASWARLLSPGQAARTAYALGFWFLFDVIQYGVSLLLPLLLVAFGGLTGETAVAVSSLLYLAEFGGTVGGAFLVDRTGRRPLQLAGFAAMAVGLALAYLGHGLLLTDPLLLVLLLLMVTLGVGIGPGILEFVYPPELFPTRTRATGSGLALSVSRLGAIVGIVLGGIYEHDPILFAIYASVGGLAFLLTLGAAPETRGRDLTDEIGPAPAPDRPPGSGKGPTSHPSPP